MRELHFGPFWFGNDVSDRVEQGRRGNPADLVKSAPALNWIFGPVWDNQRGARL